MKTKALIVLLLVAVLGLASCGVNNDNANDNQATTLENQENLTTEEVTSADVEDSTTQAPTTAKPVTTNKPNTTTNTNGASKPSTDGATQKPSVPATKTPTTNAPATEADTTKAQSLPKADLDEVSDFFERSKTAYGYVKEAFNFAVSYNNTGNAADRTNCYNKLEAAKSEFEAVRAMSTQYSNLQTTTADINNAINAINKVLSRNYSFEEELQMFNDIIDSISIIFNKIDVILDDVM